MLICEIYAATTLSITAIWVYLGRNYSFSTLAWAMFFPGLFAPWFAIEDESFFLQVLGINNVYHALVYSLAAVLLASVIVAACYVFDLATGLATKVTGNRPPLPEGSGDTLAGFLRAAGEEIGWRCYLLPCLLNHYPVLHALLISGVVWGLFHVPVMILLTRRIPVPHPWLTILVQSLSVFIGAFPYGWLAIKSGFSMWPPTVMHYAWNRINPIILGSIYTQTPGKVRGSQWIINGEGLVGCIMMLPVAFLAWYDLS